MRYERLKDIIDLAVRLQGSRGGVTLDDMQQELSVSRRTAERMRDAAEWAFGPLETVPAGDNRLHWRLRSNALRHLVRSLCGRTDCAYATAAAALERGGLLEQAAGLRDLDTKLRAVQQEATLERLESDLETLVAGRRAGDAARPAAAGRCRSVVAPARGHPDPSDRGIPLPCARSTRAGQAARTVEPYGLLYGNRAFLVGRTDWSDEPAALAAHQRERCPAARRAVRAGSGLRSAALRPALLRHVPGETRPGGPAFRCRSRCSGRFAAFLFHPDQAVEQNEDGTDHDPFRGRRARRDVLAPGDLGRDRNRRETGPPAPTVGQNVCGTFRASWG